MEKIKQKENSQSQSPTPRIRKVEENEILSPNTKIISPQGRFRKSSSQRIKIENESINNIDSCANCEKCQLTKEGVVKGINHIKSYIEYINQRLNIIYHKTGEKKKSYNGTEIDYSLPSEYYHTIYYTDLDKLNISNDVNNHFRNIMKAIRLFNEKFEYISKKHENYERMCQDFHNLKLSNRKEDLKDLPEGEIEEIKKLEIQNIFKNFNSAKENFENSLKELKSSLGGTERNTIVKYLFYFRLKVKLLILNLMN